jgi:hypothetical protein
MLNPLREILEQLGRKASERPSPFRAEAEAVLASFRDGKRELETKVRRGDLTPKVARAEATQLADGLGRALKQRAQDYSAIPRVFLDRLVEATERRKASAEHASPEVLQRETNRLLRSVLIEQQIQVRQPEFESRSYVRPSAGGQPAPTLDSLLAYHKHASVAGDAAAGEWVRRRLEEQRPLVATPEDHRRIDLATDRPDHVNPRLVAGFVEAMQGRDHEELEQFVSESVASRDTNACMAAFVLAREAPEGSRLRWVRNLLEGVDSFPDAALATLREIEAEARVTEREAAVSQAEFAIAQSENEARLSGLEAPTDAEITRRAAIQGRPVAQPGEAIGLTLDRRGAFASDLRVETTETPDVD